MKKLLVISVCYILQFFLFSCATNNEDYSNLAKVSFGNTVDSNSFTFLVSDEYLLQNTKSPADKKYPKMTVAEVKLLEKILKNIKRCIDKNGHPSFIITSKQEKIYDTTFSNLIEQNYHAKPAVPAMYFGKCLVL